MKLYLMRHADAVPQKPNQEDSERQLSPKGKKDAKEAAAKLLSTGVLLDIIFCSPYKRTVQTAEIVAKEFGIEQMFFPEPLLSPGCEFGDLMEILDHYPDCESVMCVGHEPDFGEIAAQFLDLEEPRPLAKAEIVEIEILLYIY